MARVLAVLLYVEAFGTAHSLARILPSVRVYDAVTLLLVAVRALVAVLQIVGGRKLWRRERAGALLAHSALLTSAMLMVFEVGWRMTPTNADPTFRWWFVGGYGIYVALAVGWLRRSKTA